MFRVSAEWPLFIVPHQQRKKNSQLARVAPNGQLHRLRPRLPFPFQGLGGKRRFALSEKWVVGVLPFNPLEPQMRLFRARLRANGQRLERLPDIELSPGLEVHALLLDGDWLYLGGGANRWAYQHLSAKKAPFGEYFSRLRLSDAAPVITTIPLPVEFGPGKAIDDLQRDAYGQLLVLDNVVMPKYLFFYRLYGAQLPKWLKTHKLPFARPTETYQRASWNDKFVVLLSHGVGMGGGARHISVLRRLDLKPVWLAEIRRAHCFDPVEMKKPGPYLFDAIICGSRVVFAAGLGGLGYAAPDAAALWPKRRVSGMGFNMAWKEGKSTLGPWWRYRATLLAPELDLLTAGPAEGVSWLPPAPAQPAIVETVRMAYPNVLLLTGRNNPGDLEVCWTQTLP